MLQQPLLLFLVKWNGLCVRYSPRGSLCITSFRTPTNTEQSIGGIMPILSLIGLRTRDVSDLHDVTVQ